MSIDLVWDDPEIELECDFPDCTCTNHRNMYNLEEKFKVLCKEHFEELMEVQEQLKRFQNKFGVVRIPAHDETQEESLFKD